MYDLIKSFKTISFERNADWIERDIVARTCGEAQFDFGVPRYRLSRGWDSASD